MKKSKKSIAVAFAMILGCLPKNSLAASNGKNSSANEGSSLASKKPEFVGGGKRSKKMSNSTKTIIGLGTGEMTWETLGWFLPKLWTPGKKAFKMFSKKETILKKEIKKIKKIKENKKIEKVDELRQAIKQFAFFNAVKEKDKEIYSKVMTSLSSIYEKYMKCRKELFYGYHDSQREEYDGFKVVSSVYAHWMPAGKEVGPDEKCVYILGTDDSTGLAITNWLSNKDNEDWKGLCDDAAKLNQKIVIGLGLHEDECGTPFSKRLRGYVCLGLKSDYENGLEVYNFVGEGYSIFNFVFYDEGEKINNLNELNNLK